MTSRAKMRGIVALVCGIFYLGSYAVLSWHGSYVGHNRGGSENRDTWFPAYCAEAYISPVGRSNVRLTTLGWLFLPPMLVDQWAIHPARPQ